MNWNPFKRIAELERKHAQNIAVLSSLTDRLNILNAENALHTKCINDLSNKLKQQNLWMVSLQNQIIYSDDQTRPGTPIKQDTKAEKKRAYARAYYAKKRAAKGAAK
jgi:uncharacterized coiled-coil protein SlyX